MLRKVTIALILCSLACLRAGAQDRSTPEATVRSFIAAFGIGDMKQVVACVKGAQIGGPALDALAQQIQKDPVSFTLNDAKTTVNGTGATVTGQVTLKNAKSEKAQSFSTLVNLVSSGGAWQIVPDAVKAQSANTDVVNQLAYAMTDAKVFTRARDAARATSCLSNMKQICLAAMMLAQDYDEKFKIKPDAYKKGLMPYTKNEAIFKCPADTGSGSSYAFNSNLAGVSMAKIQAPAETVLIYEGKNGKLDFRHDGKASVGFADGHAKLINAEGAKKLRWKP
jgi:prepilin-type processing-associated H-X9-DG protein